MGAFDAPLDSSKHAECDRNISAVFGRQNVFNFLLLSHFDEDRSKERQIMKEIFEIS